MQLFCPHCDTKLAARIVKLETAICMSCNKGFKLAEALNQRAMARALTASRSLRKQLDKMAKGPGKTGRTKC